ncbi:MAG: 4Fe-4S dicluster domain-containing protein [Bacteroidetes bacterium]|nr:MAG: 4Fe-4S dicluster domain-containing protein [Bacteroidota bacterium]
MNTMEDNEQGNSSRRNFLKKVGVGVGAISVAGIAGTSLIKGNETNTKSGKKVKLLSTDGKLVEVDQDDIKPAEVKVAELKEAARIGLPNRKFAMVIDLARCKNARKCVEACQEGHLLPKDHEWIKLYLLQDDINTAKYWFPRPCFHCDKPMCVSVCPVGATYKRSDGIVLVDNQRCIGCKFCMTGCPFSARVFNWKDPEVKVPEGHVYDPETNIPAVEGTVGKCVFCADNLRKNELPRCVTACPMGVIYFGDILEDTVTNGNETERFSKLILDRAGYRFREELGTLPSVFYLPPNSRMFPVERGLEDSDESIKKRYIDAGPR